MLNNKKTVFVGLSGGVDSSVSAGLLKEAGFKVVGVFIKVWEPFDFAQGKPQSQEKLQKVCTWRDDRRDAMRVASILDIPFITIDLATAYKQGVVDYMVAEYQAGRTPNPDVMCNKEIKFGVFYNWALENGADFIATGHYAQIEHEALHFKLKMGADQNKDQSYFLWNIKTDQLPHILFPIGHLEKPAVRKLAEKFKLPTATKKDSQGLCFIGKLDIKEFLSDFIEIKKGDVCNEQGEVIGWHNGVYFYTIGERHGFTITRKTPEDRPYYIVGKDVAKNILIVANQDTKQKTDEQEVTLEKVNWLAGSPEEGKTYQGRFRYRQTLFPCTLRQVSGAWIATISSSDDIPSGQSLVIYDQDVCLGGGVIK